MIDLDRVVGFQWDIGNSRKSTDGHGISQAEAEQVFANGPLLLVEDVAHSQLEPRFHALGVTFDQGDFPETAGRFAREDQVRGQ